MASPKPALEIPITGVFCVPRNSFGATGLPALSTIGMPVDMVVGVPKIGWLPASPTDPYCAVSVAVGSSALRVALSSISPFNRRSEEHTSELQSHLNLVCRLLLEKNK